jgi:hypothetical protein
MNAPDSKNISIRLEINIPTPCAGGPDPAVRLLGPDRPVRFEGVSEARMFKNPIPPDDEDTLWDVHPTDTGLGTICAQVEYDDPQYKVWAAVYPALFYPAYADPTHPLAGWAEAGTPSSGNTVWNWAGANAAYGAAHSSIGAPNKLAIWRQTTSTSSTVFEGSSSFSGVTNETQCSSASGSSVLAGELAYAAALLVSVPDGRYAGHYLAMRVTNRTWKVTIGEAKYTITSRTGQDLFIGRAGRFVASKKITPKPFSAFFPGKIFGARGDVVVTVK